MKMKQGDPPEIDRDFVMNYFLKTVPKPVSFRELLELMDLNRNDRPALKKALLELTGAGELVYVRGKRFGLPMKMNLLHGVLSCSRDGVGYVMPEKGGEQILVRQPNMGGAMHGDEVIARIEEKRRRGRLEGRIIRILRRAHRVLIGRYIKVSQFGCVVPVEEKIFTDIRIPYGESGGAVEGMLVEAEIVEYPSSRGGAVGRILQTIGYPSDPAVDLQLVMRFYDLPGEFPPEVLKAANEIETEVHDADIQGRKDFRKDLLVTIDGEDARDFDDAVSIELLPSEGYRLGVHIADVSHYVSEGSVPDLEARLRGTSTYFPDKVIPMLPFELSHGICSLNPGVDRLTMSVLIDLDREGRTLSYTIHPAVIRSAARLTYTEVEKVIEKKTGRGRAVNEELVRSLLLMAALSRKLRRKREKRGSLDFDLPASEFIRDAHGEVMGIYRAPRLRSHSIIEEFMILANEVVAEYLTRREIPFLYRIHEEPEEDAYEELSEILTDFGIRLKGKSPKDFQHVLSALKGRPEESYLSHFVLRTLMLARYSPVNRGHFGLASLDYCHFTSPIRRYPDLVVHRILKEALKSGSLGSARTEELNPELPSLAVECSRLERRSEEAEREFVDRKKARFMEDKIGETFSGHVSGVASFGFFVELDEYFIEGLVRLTSLGDDYYCFLERERTLRGENSGRTFRIGDAVQVRVSRVEVLKGFVDFVLDGTKTRKTIPLYRRRRNKRSS